MTIDIRGLQTFNGDEKETRIELGRLTFKNSGTSVYLPKRVCDTLKLDSDRDLALVIFLIDGKSLFLIKDKALSDMLKPRILDMREHAEKRFYRG